MSLPALAPLVRSRCWWGIAAALATVLAVAPCKPLVAQQPTVFVHGLTGDGTAWADAASWLASEVPITPILPTLGWPAPFETQASTLHDALGSNQNVIGVGGSNGAIVLRRYVQIFGGASKIDRVLAVGSLHEGALLAQRVTDGTLSTYAGGLFGSLLLPLQWSLNYDPSFGLPSAIEIAINNLADFSDVLPGLVLSIGFDTGAPVLVQMSPSSGFIASLNSANALAVEANNTLARVGIGTGSNPSGAVFRELGLNVSTWMTWRAAVASFALGMHDYYVFDAPLDWWVPHAADLWLDMYFALSDMDLDWAWLIGAYVNGSVVQNDGVVPLPTQQYPGATRQENLLFPAFDIAHQEQKDHPAVRSLMKDAFEVDFQVSAPTPLQVSVIGPSQVLVDGVQSWSASVQGGEAPYQYAWFYQIDYQTSTCTHQTPWIPVGSNQDEFSQFVSTQDYDFRVRVDIQDADSATASGGLKVYVGDGSQECPQFIPPPDTISMSPGSG